MAPVSHEAYLAAYDSLSTLADVERLSREGGGLSFEALLCILSQKMLQLTKTSIGRHRRPEVAQQYVQRVLAGGQSLLSLAEEVALPPTMLARVVLEAHLGVKKGKVVGQLLKDPWLIADERMRREVASAVEEDPHYGPHIDTVKRVMGLEHEELLQQRLRAQGVPFLTEEELRLRGDAKTPDALLPVPLLVRGRVVNWIDSKATFGDPASHAEYRANQFSGYVNRFDAGLVVYWFGYDESIDNDPRVLVLDDLRPADCELMTVHAVDSQQAGAPPGGRGPPPPGHAGGDSSPIAPLRLPEA